MVEQLGPRRETQSVNPDSPSPIALEPSRPLSVLPCRHGARLSAKRYAAWI
jgi:hypothetical protein